MTSPAVPGRRSRPLLGWPLAVIGWLVAVSSPAIFWVTNVPAEIVAFASAVIVTAGCAAIGLRAGSKIIFLLMPTLFFGGFGLVVGLGTMTEQLVFHLVGKTATCQVTAVHKVVDQVVTTGSDGTSRSSEDVSFLHTTVCPNATYTIHHAPPYPVGTKAQVSYDPHGKVDPRFSDQLPGIRRTGLIASAVGGLVVLVAPFAAWGVGRRRKETTAPNRTPPRPAYPADGPGDSASRFDPARSVRSMEALNDIQNGRKVSGFLKLRRLQAERLEAEKARGREQWPPLDQ